MRCLLTFFFSDIPFFIEWWIGLDWRSPGFHGVEIHEEINSVSIKMYLCYLEYFQEGNGFLGWHMLCSDRTIWLQMLCLNFFLVTETNKVSGLTISKMSVMSVIFILYFFEYSNILFSYQVRKSYWGLYSRTESIFRKLIVTFLYV